MPNQDHALELLYDNLNAISPLSLELWKEAKLKFTLKQYAKGERLFDIGDKVTDFYFLIDGIARYYYINDEGKEFNKSFAGRVGHLLSSISSVSMKEELSPFGVEILSEFSVLVISYEDFLYLGEKHLQWQRLHLRMFERLIVKKERREEDFLTLSAQERYEKFLLEFPMVDEIIPNYHIASYLGITEVALSRIRKKMKLTYVNDKI